MRKHETIAFAQPLLAPVAIRHWIAAYCAYSLRSGKQLAVLPHTAVCLVRLRRTSIQPRRLPYKFVLFRSMAQRVEATE